MIESPSEGEKKLYLGYCLCNFFSENSAQIIFLDIIKFKPLIMYSMLILMQEKQRYHFGGIFFKYKFCSLGIKLLDHM